jgi:hypothetical protein
MYGPAVRYTSFSRIRQIRSWINVSGLCLERIVLRAIMDISAHAISLAERPLGNHQPPFGAAMPRALRSAVIALLDARPASMQRSMCGRKA